MAFCNICELDLASSVEAGVEAPVPIERARVHSNVRAFAEESFEVWRCPRCRSIHAGDEVDLERYYAQYPFHGLVGPDKDWKLAAMYRHLLGRLRAHGFGTEHRLLDYGCGSGHFLSYCRGKGYDHVAGYDAYSEKYGDRSVLQRQYDVVLSQDVVEHVPSPRAHLQTLGELVKPGGRVVIGTPNANAIDLAQPQLRVHTLHQPYHRHILSNDALKALGAELGWKLLQYYPTMYSNTRVPFVNLAFVNHYLRCFDDVVDVVLEPVRIDSIRLFSPASLWLGLFGSFFAPETDVMAVFAVPE